MKIFPISLLLGALLITAYPVQTQAALPKVVETAVNTASTLLESGKNIAQTLYANPEAVKTAKFGGLIALGLTSYGGFLGFFKNMIDVHLGYGAYTWTGDQHHLDFGNKALTRARICLAVGLGSLAGAGYLLYRG